MKIYTSYFYQVRNFHPWTFGFSTARWDPKWFHAWSTQDYVYFDKRQVLNGLRCPPLVHNSNLSGICSECHGKKWTPKTCKFMSGYAGQLDDLDFKEIIGKFEKASRELCARYGIKDVEPEVCLLVHEAPWKECSERIAIQDWFKSHGWHITEWRKDINDTEESNFVSYRRPERLYSRKPAVRMCKYGSNEYSGDCKEIYC